MCQDCGCGDSELVPVEVHDRILAANDARARHNREHFVERGVVAVNLMGSPGSGKTALLEATARAFADRRRLAAVSGDLATDLDGERLRAAGIPARTITTGSACHLDAAMVHAALHHLAWGEADYLFIENVGNLVCPAVYDLGQALNAVVLSITEGEDKPLKYPVMFKQADVVLLTKVDLVPHLPGTHLSAFVRNLERVMPEPVVFPLAAVRGLGIAPWLDWLEERRAATLSGAASELAKEPA
jgi:hydrogenase nickel incorporation protein HypB